MGGGGVGNELHDLCSTGGRDAKQEKKQTKRRETPHSRQVRTRALQPRRDVQRQSKGCRAGRLGGAAGPGRGGGGWRSPLGLRGRTSGGIWRPARRTRARPAAHTRAHTHAHTHKRAHTHTHRPRARPAAASRYPRPHPSAPASPALPAAGGPLLALSRPARRRTEAAAGPRPGPTAAPHLLVEKGHAARLGLVLVRAVRHLGVKSLPALHAGKEKAFRPRGTPASATEPNRGRRRSPLPGARAREERAVRGGAAGAREVRAKLDCAGAAVDRRWACALRRGSAQKGAPLATIRRCG